MRTPFRLTIGTLALALAGCSSGVTVVRQPPPAPRPVPVVIEPLEVDIARPHNGKIYIQTNRPAYVAVFDIIPERGVALVYPVSARQRRFVVSGMREVPAWWESSRVTYHANGMGSRRSEPARYIYALASDRPLRIPDEAFGNDYLYASLGPRAYRSNNPYATMRALARQFLPPVAEEAWAEDAYGVSRSYATERYRVIRVYCRDGSVYEVAAEFADRVWCGTRSRGGTTVPGRVYDGDLTSDERPLRPDSIVGDNGRRLAVRARGANGHGGVKRVQEPPGWDNRANGEDDKLRDDKVKEERIKDDPPGRAHAGNKPENTPNGRSDRSDDSAQDAPPGRDPAVRNREPAPRRPALIPDRTQSPQSADNAEKANKDDKPNAAEKGNDADQPDKSEKPEKSKRLGYNGEPKSEPGPKTDSRAEGPSEPKPAAEPQPKAESKDETKAQEKSQSPSDKRGEPEKGRGRPNAPDDKPGEKKSKQAPDSKPLK